MKKNTILFGISIVNMVLFLIGMIILFAAAASGSADGNNFALILSIISGVIFEIITIVQIVKEKKSAKEDSSFFPYCVACFKKKNGKPMFQLVVAAILNVLPLALFIVLLIAIVLFTSSDSKTANNISKGIDLIADNSQTSGKSKPKKNTASQSKKSGESGKSKDLSNQELNTIASHSGNDMKTITPGDDKKIKKIYQDNPGISDEDAFEIFKKTNPNATLETVRAHKPTLNNTNDELNVIARSGNNNIKTTTPGDDKKIKKIYQDNPGISDEDAFEIFKKSNPNATLETVRAHRPENNYTNDELNVIARSGNNNIKTTTPGDDKKIKKIYQDNPGISDEDAFGIFKKSNPNATLETVRAHKPR